MRRRCSRRDRAAPLVLNRRLAYRHVQGALTIQFRRGLVACNPMRPSGSRDRARPRGVASCAGAVAGQEEEVEGAGDAEARPLVGAKARRPGRGRSPGLLHLGTLSLWAYPQRVATGRRATRWGGESVGRRLNQSATCCQAEWLHGGGNILAAPENDPALYSSRVLTLDVKRKTPILSS